MIIWLASYPRSGNTLLRTILKRCFGFHSYVDEPIYHSSPLRDNPNLIGHLEYSEDWDHFYEHACQSSETVFVKTHLPPRDTQPFIYVVRDGRAAIKSYREFHKHYNRINKAIVSLIVGDDVYGDWTTHFYNWNERPVNSLLLSFEDLVEVSNVTLTKIAEFLGYDGKISEWINPFSKLQKLEPKFFSKKRKGCELDETWTFSIEYLFNKIHGPLMHKLQYYEFPPEMKVNANAFSELDKLLDEIVDILRTILADKVSLANTCKERLAVINTLQNVCDKRLQLILSLNKGKKT